MEATQVERRYLGFGRTSTSSPVTLPTDDSVVRCAIGATTSLAFGRFQVWPYRRELVADGQPVPLGSRALDILTVLAENAGRVVSKKELIARVWPNTCIEEINLRIQVSALRRALGDGRGGARYVLTVPGRGYEFVAPVSRTEAAPVSTPPTVAAAGRHNLPVAMTRMIGRDESAAILIARLSRERLVTIVGPGGIGKTTLALAVAEAMLSAYEHGVWFVDLASLVEPALVASTVATVLGLETDADDPLPRLADGLRNRRMLLVLDNCEHVIEAAAELAVMLLRSTPGISILATSRERLEVAGEREHRLRPLATPTPSPVLTAADALSFAAVQLFAERVSTVADDFALTDADAPLVAEICRGLDGLPLGIELAAAWFEVLGVRGLATNLRDSSGLLRARHRFALPRHRTIRVVLDWSYGLLDDNEKRFFRRLGIFPGSFSIEAAAKVATDASQTQGDAVELLANLVAKSLLAVDIGGAKPHFRLFETTGSYALEKLVESGEREQIAGRHAQYRRDLFEHAEAEWEVRSTAEWLVQPGAGTDDPRAVPDWAFSPGATLLSVLDGKPPGYR